MDRHPPGLRLGLKVRPLLVGPSPYRSGLPAFSRPKHTKT
jgi:hypothetical protein